MAFGHEEEQAVIRVMRSGLLSGYKGNYSDEFYGGIEVKALEKEWQDCFKVKHAIFCNSATSGLFAACAILNLKPKDEVIVTPYSMVCSATMPLNFKAVPVFADIEKDYFCLDPDDIERKITDKTRAIIVVNLFGMPADYDKINAMAKKHGLTVIEDNAQGIGATYHGKYAGTLGGIGVFSLNVHKHINCGEGGVICANDDKAAFKLRLIVNHSESIINDIDRRGKSGEFEYFDELIPLVGQNLRGVELSAAVAREQLKKLDGILAKYRDNSKYFPVKVRPDCESAFYRYAWLNSTQNPLGINWLEYKTVTGIPINIKRHYIKPIFQMPLFRSLGYDQDDCPVCREVDEDIVLAWPKEAGK